MKTHKTIYLSKHATLFLFIHNNKKRIKGGVLLWLDSEVQTGKKSRRLGISLSGTGKELEKRPYAPGQHGPNQRKKIIRIWFTIT